MQIARTAEKKAFLHSNVTGVDKWIHYDNLKRKKTYGYIVHRPLRSNIHGKKLMLYAYMVGPAWCDLLGAVKNE